jgi:hypothetical protein
LTGESRNFRQPPELVERVERWKREEKTRKGKRRAFQTLLNLQRQRPGGPVDEDGLGGFTVSTPGASEGGPGGMGPDRGFVAQLGPATMPGLAPFAPDKTRLPPLARHENGHEAHG